MGAPPALPSSEGPVGSLGNASRREFIDLNYISNYIWYLLAWGLQLDNAQQIKLHLFQLHKNNFFLSFEVFCVFSVFFHVLTNYLLFVSNWEGNFLNNETL